MPDTMQHERHRWGYMDYRALSTRLNRITRQEKMILFVNMAERVADRRESCPNVSFMEAYQLLNQAISRCNLLGFSTLGRQAIRSRTAVEARMNLSQQEEQHPRNLEQNMRDYVQRFYYPIWTMSSAGEILDHLEGRVPVDSRRVTITMLFDWMSQYLQLEPAQQDRLNARLVPKGAIPEPALGVIRDVAHLARGWGLDDLYSDGLRRYKDYCGARQAKEPSCGRVIRFKPKVEAERKIRFRPTKEEV